MTEKPILFNTEMVRAILDGRKIQTRRVIKPQPDEKTESFRTDDQGNFYPYWDAKQSGGLGIPGDLIKCPYGAPGDQIWVRETWAIVDCGSRVSLSKKAWSLGWPTERLQYIADNPETHYWNKRPSIFMPRWASRIQLKVKNIRVERVQDITGKDAIAEGIEREWVVDKHWYKSYVSELPANFTNPINSFRSLWNSINESRGFGWAVNPFCWCIEFEVMK